MAPTNRGEYAARFQEGYRISGDGVKGLTQHIPCPWCGAPDWKVYPAVALIDATQEEATCVECGRSGKLELLAERGFPTFEIRQTKGDEPDPWVPDRLKAPGYAPPIEATGRFTVRIPPFDL